MAIIRTSIPDDCSSVANYNAMGNAISTAFSTFGWVKTSDTGQVTTWGSVAVPGSGVWTTYELWRANDSWQATMPMYVRIDYGTTGSSNGVQLRFTLGTGSNGSGSVTNGVLVGPITNTISLNSNTALYDSFFSGNSGRMQMFLWRNSPVGNTNSNLAISIERSCDSTGVENDDFTYITYSGRGFGATGCSNAWISKTGGAGSHTYAETNINNDASTLWSGGVAIFPARPVIGYERNPLLGLIRGAVNDWTDGDITSVQVYPGTYHNYIVFKNFTYYGATVGGNNCLLMRYE